MRVVPRRAQRPVEGVVEKRHASPPRPEFRLVVPRRRREEEGQAEVSGLKVNAKRRTGHGTA